MMSTETTLSQGAYRGTGPSEDRIDPLDVIARLACELAETLTDSVPSTFYKEDQPVLHELLKARKILVLNARDVPRQVDEIIDVARAHGGLKR